ncbi:putative protein isoform X1 [Capsicum galapagoense]
MFKQIFSIGDAALNKVSWPVAFAIRKAADGNPEIQQVIAQAAKKHNKEEKEFIDKSAKVLVVSTIGLVYYNSGKSREELLLERVEKLEQRKNENVRRQQMPELASNVAPTIYTQERKVTE